MRRSVLDEIAGLPGLTHVFVLTFNVDLAFVEQAVLPKLRACGHPALTVIADGACAAESFARQARYAPRLGTRYRVAAVPMRPGAAFHPKAILATSSARATLFVGSGNASFGGWRENAEVWTRFATDEGGAPEVAAFLSYLDDVMDLLLDPAALRAEVRQAVDPATRVWARSTVAPGGLVGRAGRGASLLERAGAMLGSGPVDELIVAAPYFDVDADALQALTNTFRPTRGRLLVPLHGNTLLASARARLDSRWTVRATHVLRATEKRANKKPKAAVESVKAGPPPRAAFIHAKCYALLRGTEATVLVGSANASRAAWTVSGDAGNAELMAVRSLTADALETMLRDELPLATEDLSLPDSIEEDDEEGTDAGWIVASARYADGELTVRWRVRGEGRVTGIVIDGSPTPCPPNDVREMIVSQTAAPSHVTIQAQRPDGSALSVSVWVDDERALGTSAHERRLLDEAEAYGRTEGHELDSWFAFLAPFLEDLEAAAPIEPGRSHTPPAHEADEKQRSETFDYAEVFPADEPSPDVDTARLLTPGTIRDRAAYLRQLLLTALGTHITVDEPIASEAVEEEQDSDGAPNGTPATPSADKRAAPQTVVPGAPSEAARDRAKKSIKRLVKSILQPANLEHQAARKLRTDLSLASALLRSATREGWIDHATMLELSRDALGLLLVVGAAPRAASPERGWLTTRAERDASGAFARDLGSLDFVASVSAWLCDALALASLANTDAVHFERAGLAAATSLPSIFDRVRSNGFPLELARQIAAASSGLPQQSWREASQRTRRWARAGAAARRLEARLAGAKIQDLRAHAPDAKPTIGALVYTGRRQLAVVAQVDGGIARVLPLRGGAEQKFGAEYLALIVPGVTSTLGDDAAAWVADVERGVEALGVMLVPVRVGHVFR